MRGQGCNLEVQIGSCREGNGRRVVCGSATYDVGGGGALRCLRLHRHRMPTRKNHRPPGPASDEKRPCVRCGTGNRRDNASPANRSRIGPHDCPGPADTGERTFYRCADVANYRAIDATHSDRAIDYRSGRLPRPEPASLPSPRRPAGPATLPASPTTTPATTRLPATAPSLAARLAATTQMSPQHCRQLSNHVAVRLHDYPVNDNAPGLNTIPPSAPTTARDFRLGAATGSSAIVRTAIDATQGLRRPAPLLPGQSKPLPNAYYVSDGPRYFHETAWQVAVHDPTDARRAVAARTGGHDTVDTTRHQANDPNFYAPGIVTGANGSRRGHRGNSWHLLKISQR